MGLREAALSDPLDKVPTLAFCALHCGPRPPAQTQASQFALPSTPEESVTDWVWDVREGFLEERVPEGPGGRGAEMVLQVGRDPGGLPSPPSKDPPVVGGLYLPPRKGTEGESSGRRARSLMQTLSCDPKEGTSAAPMAGVGLQETAGLGLDKGAPGLGGVSVGGHRLRAQDGRAPRAPATVPPAHGEGRTLTPGPLSFHSPAPSHSPRPLPSREWLGSKGQDPSVLTCPCRTVGPPQEDRMAEGRAHGQSSVAPATPHG